MKMNVKNLASLFLVAIFLCVGKSAYAEYISFSMTNMQTNESQSFKLGKQINIPIRGLKGWKSCIATEPQSKYINEIKIHVRQYAVQCTADSGVAIALVCALSDAKKDFDGASTTLYSSDASQPESRMLLVLSCAK